MGAFAAVGKGIRKVIGSRNERLIKAYKKQVDLTNEFEEELRGDYDRRFEQGTAKLPSDLPEDERAVEVQKIRVELSESLRNKTDELRQRLTDGEEVEIVQPEAFAVVREASRRAQNHRHFDCQIIGGQVLFEGKIAEMKTGEGKTIVCHLAAYVQCLLGKKVHIITVNDYLVQRDAAFAQPIFELVGLTVGFIQSQVDPGGHQGVRSKAYACNITYGTNNEFGFDYLRDNMKTSLGEQVQGSLDFAIIDEVDSILIDEARTPLIISGPAEDDVTRYRTANAVSKLLISKQSTSNNATASRLREWGKSPPKQYTDLPKFDEAVKKFKTDPNWINEDEAEAIGHMQYYVVAKERKSVGITHEGVTVAQEQLGVGSLYVGANMEWPHLIENSVRAYAVYERDVDYVVKDGEVIIVDPFTGRLMQGRQWSDGLHQAVEAKEGVRVKEESQTLATITLQNFFKLYGKIAGMTGTAMTEADEFMKIYKLDVVAVPTNRPVNRMDFNDRIYKTVEDKYDAIVEEIHDIHTRGRPNDSYVLEPVLKNLKRIAERNGSSTELIDKALSEFNGGDGEGKYMAEAFDDAMGELARGRPILVGTISIENSENLSNLLTKKYGIEHEVLNAKQHAREAEIVTKAGECHERKRGKQTDVCGNVTIATNMAGRGTDIKLQQGVVFPKCIGDLGPPENGHRGKFNWQEKGVIGTKCCIECPDYDPKTNCAHCWKPKVDPRFPELGRMVCAQTTPCGLHIVGTERHESRRIDNQLRGRSGRQGDPGSSRFFLSLGDDLMRMFMGEWTLKMLERMGFEEGMAIEAKSISKGIARAQKKVEEKNFSIRKNLLEYDEVMDHQRHVFYSQRQSILEATRPGKSEQLIKMIWKMFDDTIAAAARKCLDPDFAARCVCDWARGQVDCSLEPKHIDIYDAAEIERFIRASAKEDAVNQIMMTVGEYMDEDTDPKQWDIRGLARWAETRFGSTISQNQLRNMSSSEVQQHLVEASEKKVDAVDLRGLEPFLDPDFGRLSLLDWARHRFGIDFTRHQFTEVSNEDMTRALDDKVKQSYREREVAYSVEWILNKTLLSEKADDAYTLDVLVQWVNLKFDLDWTVDNLRNRSVKEVSDELFALNRKFVRDGRIDREVDTAVSQGKDLGAWGEKRFGPAFDREIFDGASDKDVVLKTFGRDMLRRELTALERYVLLQIYDSSWKEHMYAVDLLKEAIGLRGYAEQDPKIAYKREGFKMFQEMMGGIQEKVTTIIFKARLAGDADARSRYNIGAAQHAESANLGFAGGAQTDADRQAAMRAQGEKKVETIVRDKPKVGRNAPCPCGSGKKSKQCCGKAT